MSLVPDPMVWKHCWNDLCLSLICSSQTGHVESYAFDKSLDDPSSTDLASKKHFVDLLALLMEEHPKLPMLWNLLV